jgi:hypothetical protein
MSVTTSKNSSERWEQIKTAYASGIGLREIARNMGSPEDVSISITLPASS